MKEGGTVQVEWQGKRRIATVDRRQVTTERARGEQKKE
jgi:hypothetical protein